MDNTLDRRIGAFIARHHVLTLATVEGDQPWCCSLFYAFDKERVRLIFSSSDSSRHIRQGVASARVACSIVVESRVIGRLQGVQIEGRLVCVEGDEECRGVYLGRFPFARVRMEVLWAVEVDRIKFTDNTLGFGRKLYFPNE